MLVVHLSSCPFSALASPQLSTADSLGLPVQPTAGLCTNQSFSWSDFGSSD